MFTTLKMAGKDKSITGAIEAGVLSTEQKPQYRRICVFVGLAWTVPFQKSFVSDLRSHQNVFVNSKTTRYCGLISCLFVLCHLLTLPLLLSFTNTIPSLLEGPVHLASLFYELSTTNEKELL